MSARDEQGLFALTPEEAGVLLDWYTDHKKVVRTVSHANCNGLARRLTVWKSRADEGLVLRGD